MVVRIEVSHILNNLRGGMGRVADPDPHYFGKLNSDPYYNEKLDLDPRESQISRAFKKLEIGAAEGRVGSQWRRGGLKWSPGGLKWSPGGP
jgi:hypothetical protein